MAVSSFKVQPRDVDAPQPLFALDHQVALFADGRSFWVIWNPLADRHRIILAVKP
jgi:hypothetical protein